MSLLGPAAMLLSFDIAADAIAEHDDWHTHEHLPERLSIPGFIRGTRWISLRGQPRYFVMYEVAQLATLSSEAYLQRLNNPTPWTSKIMTHYRSMRRGLLGNGQLWLRSHTVCWSLQNRKPAETRLRTWLVGQVLPQLRRRPVSPVFTSEGTLTPQMTNEQRIRGADAGVDWAILVTGYRQEALAELSNADLGTERLAQHGASGVHEATYDMDYSLSHDEIDV
jgi:prophage antirepressor-like protein